MTTKHCRNKSKKVDINKLGMRYMEALGMAARKTLEKTADDLNIHGEMRKEMLKINSIHISGRGFHDVYGEETKEG